MLRLTFCHTLLIDALRLLEQYILFHKRLSKFLTVPVVVSRLLEQVSCLLKQYILFQT